MSDRECWCGKALLYRRELPARRGGENFEFVVGETKFTASTRRERGAKQVTEVFINAPKIDSDVDLTIRDAAVVISVALQYGVPIAEMAKSTGQNTDGKPSSPIGQILQILLHDEQSNGPGQS